ncbi:MOLPALP family lipoprotein [Mesoplasma lactucae]|uniref:Uncharacterized protein n=1 Tax=Mesoplasma lactucae ATCC 49193 TaxID=81460 RepID=A0A291IR33_9MOLU|nr:MOLPALP family lipoprotein [Mesoplasma lactucae]ATG97210.1 hypothetical protein CP520_00320 [Mesoplasma lactucae ATCC 49193]ATZ20348.1 MOLPALP family lipoprotein [Mesoplasma lactucae ATCC 49193]MCL8216519.1 hypothetical protein [Mesoplasma lactucae ATCC 49193]
MRKLLAILGSVSLIASSSSAVVACTSTKETNKVNDETYFNNNLANMMGAGFDKAKALILDDQFGISQTQTLKGLSNIKASKTNPDFNPNDGNLNNHSMSGDVISKYFGNQVIGDKAITGKNISYGNQNGEMDGISALIPDQIRPIYERVISVFKGSETFIEPFMNANSLNQNLDGIYNLASGFGTTVNDLINKLLQALKVDVSGFNKSISGAITSVNGVFGSEVVNQIRNVLTHVGNDYDTLVNNAHKDITDNVHKFSDIRGYVDTQIESILDHIVDFDSDDGLEIPFMISSLQTTGTLTSLEAKIITLVDTLIKKQNVPINPALKGIDAKSAETALMPLLQPIVSLIMVSNVAFQKLDQYKDYEPIDKEHLFDAKIKNYDWLNTFSDTAINDQTSPVLADKALNINYFVSNLNYYFGKIQDADDQATYRLQQLLFLLFNDKSDKQENKNINYGVQNSTLLSHIYNIGFGIGYLETLPPDDAGEDYDSTLNLALMTCLSSPQIKTQIMDGLVKPIILGLINGDDWNYVVVIVNDILNTILKGNLIPALNNYPTSEIIKAVQRILQNSVNNPDFLAFPFRSLMMGDLSKLIKGVNIPDNIKSTIDIIFGQGNKNLFGLLNKPLWQILSLFGMSVGLPGIKGTIIPNFGDQFTLLSIPELISLLNSYMNNVFPNEKNLSKYVTYKKDKDGKDTTEIDLTHSLEIFNLKPKLVIDLIMQVIGTKTDGTDNLISKFLSALFGITADGGQTPPSPTSKTITVQLADDSGDKPSDGGDTPTPPTVKITIDVQGALNVLGFEGSDTYKNPSLLGDIMQLSLPLLKVTGDTFTLADESVFKIDLMNREYKNFISLFDMFTSPADYQDMIRTFVTDDSIYNYQYDPSSVKYFADTNKKLVKSYDFTITFKNPIDGTNTKYWFSVKRNSNAEVFEFYNVVNNTII